MVMNSKTLNLPGHCKNSGKRHRVISYLVVTLLITFTPLASQLAFAELRAIDRIVAIVNEDVVMSSELEERVEALTRKMARSQEQMPTRAEIIPQVLDKLIQDRLQLEIGKRAGVQVSDDQLNEALNKTAQQQGLSLDEFINYARQDGLTLRKLRQQFKEEMIVSRVQQAMVSRRIEITDQEIDNFLNSEEGKFMSSPEVDVGHILLRLSSKANEQIISEMMEKAEALQGQLNEGADFRQLAMIHSAGPNALQGGNLGWRKTSQLPGLFTLSIDTLTPGQVSEILRSDAGIHLLKLYDRRGGGEQLIEQSQIRHILIKPNEIRSDDAAKELISNLREQILREDNFAELARLHSEDPGSALKGGDLGWSMPGQFVPEFEQAISQLEVGIVSPPIFTQYGWHLIEVTAHRKQDFSSEILRNQATNQIRQRKFAEELQVWMEEIRSEAFIEIKS